MDSIGQNTHVQDEEEPLVLDEEEAKKILMSVFEQLKKSGYNPITQIMWYLITEDPTYISAKGGARTKIAKLDRDQMLIWMVKHYLESLEDPV